MKFNKYKRMLLEADAGASGGSDTSTTETDTTVDDSNTEQKEEKTYTQDDVNKMIKDRLARERKSQPSKEDLEAFNNWKESRKTDEEKRNEALKNAETKVKEAEERASNLEAKVSCLSKGVNANSVDDVVILAKSMVSDDITIDQAIEKVLEKYPSFKTQQVQEEKKGFKIGSETKDQKQLSNEALSKIFGNTK